MAQMKTMYSGGAKGSDTYWSQKAEAKGWRVVNYSFKGHGCANIGEIVRLTDAQLQEADPSIEIVNQKYLHRGEFKNYSNFVKNLIRRNFWQVRDSGLVCAVAERDDKGLVAGGTAWAVYMAINMLVPVFLYSQELGLWKTYIEGQGWVWRDAPPEFPDHWTGIGSRNLTDEGKRAIDFLL